jgi:hypothetical protein
MQKNKSLFKNLLLIDTVEYRLQILTVNGSDYKSEPAGNFSFMFLVYNCVIYIVYFIIKIKETFIFINVTFCF